MKSKEEIDAENHPPIILLDYCIQYDMPLETWGFKPNAKFFAEYHPGPIANQLPLSDHSARRAIPTVIYNSQKCRIMFQLEPSGHFYSYATHIYYSRLHTQNDIPTIKWNGEECDCWHSIAHFTLPFLEGDPPSKIKKSTDYMAELRESAATNRPSTPYSEITTDGRSQLQKLADDCKGFFIDTNTEHITSPIRLHAAIWNKYGNKLFDLFDFQNVELWSKYSQYIKECYDINDFTDFMKMC